MLLGPIFSRELMTSARRTDSFQNRAYTAVLAAAIVGGCAGFWDWKGWDRASVAGASAFGLRAFAAIVAVQAFFVMVIIPSEVAPGVAGERDRRSLDALLATRLAGVEVILGVMGAGLVRYASSLAAAVPVVALLLGGVDPRLVLLAGAGLASTAVAVAALSVAASVGAPTAKQALATAVSLASAWMFLPFAVVLFLPRLWPAAAWWLVPPALWLMDGSPVAVLANVTGIVRRASPVGAVLRMIGLQLAAAVALTAWAAWRLRPASRRLYDGVGRAAFLRSLRTRRRPRPACGDDPVLWNEVHSSRGVGEVGRLVRRLINVISGGLLALLMGFFAASAFEELAARGYGASPEAMTPPEMTPLLRLIVSRFSGAYIAPAPGQARLEFNIALRQLSAAFGMLFAMGVAGFASEAVAAERERDTWLGLIATPLTGWEILRAKGLGAIWRCREVVFVLLALWAVGLLAGSLHPLGLLAGLLGLAASAWFSAALGISASLRTRDRQRSAARVSLSLGLLTLSVLLLFLPRGYASVLLGSGSNLYLTWSSLLSYEDVRAAATTGAFPQLESVNIHTGEGAGRVLAAWLLGTGAQVLAAYLLTRAAARDFDAVVGRAMRARMPDSLGSLRGVPVQERSGLGE